MIIALIPFPWWFYYHWKKILIVDLLYPIWWPLATEDHLQLRSWNKNGKFKLNWLESLGENLKCLLEARGHANSDYHIGNYSSVEYSCNWTVLYVMDTFWNHGTHQPVFREIVYPVGFGQVDVWGRETAIRQLFEFPLISSHLSVYLDSPRECPLISILTPSGIGFPTWIWCLTRLY